VLPFLVRQIDHSTTSTPYIYIYSEEQIFDFQTYIIFSINLVSLVTLRSSGTDMLYGFHIHMNISMFFFINLDVNVKNIVKNKLYKS
jgi:hypothetical protein